jgi:hypothetical protein
MDGRPRAPVGVFPDFPHTHAARRGRTHRRASWEARQRPRLWLSPQILMRLQWHAQRKRWFRNGQKWRTGCEERISVGLCGALAAMRLVIVANHDQSVAGQI